MTVKGGRHQLTGMAAFGEFYNDMKRIESGTELRMTLQNAILAFSKKSHAAKAIWIHVSFNSHIEYKVDWVSLSKSIEFEIRNEQWYIIYVCFSFQYLLYNQ